MVESSEHAFGDLHVCKGICIEATTRYRIKKPMLNLPKISIVTPSYNQAQFLERSIISVLNQNYPNLEYVVIDGGSTDGSVEVIKKYEKYLAYWVSEPDKGQSEAINKGFGRSTGEITAWLNSDDMYLPGAFFRVAEMFREHPDAAFVYGDYIKIDGSDRCIGLRRQPSFDYKICLYSYPIAIQPASFFRRSAVLKLGGVDPGLYYVMDWDLILRLARHGPTCHIPSYVAALRFHSTCKTVVQHTQKLPVEHPNMRLRHLKGKPFAGELVALRLYHTARLAIRMLKEGCLASRFGKDMGEYKLNCIYTPKYHGLPDEA